MSFTKIRAARNRTITLSSEETALYQAQLLRLIAPVTLADFEQRVINQNIFDALNFLPARFIDLLFLDPPYNLDKTFNGSSFKKTDLAEYESWIESWLKPLLPMLKPTASIYFCGNWEASPAIYSVLSRYFTVRNRITWEREKGRGAKANWKSAAEDIWFATVSDEYTFNVEAVKLKRKVIAPYRNAGGVPKDWDDGDDGKFRLTYPSNLWTDISVPFWSMPENTDHPTQKPEKLLAKIVLASSAPGDFVFDPFLGSGTSAVVAKKLGRRFAGIELDEFYCCLAQKRLALATSDKAIQGYSDGVFWERNSFGSQQSGQARPATSDLEQVRLPVNW